MAIRIAASLVAPFLIYGTLLILLHEVSASWPDWIGVALLLSSATAGFAFLKEELEGAAAVIVGLIYFPCMLGLLLYFSLVIAVRIYGEGP